jgi:hypothetical protein
MNLRLVSREWKNASTPFVFDNVQLRLFASSQRKFKELCHSEMAKYVRSVDFHPDLLPSWNKETWLSRVDTRPELHPRGHMLSLDPAEVQKLQDAHDKLPRHTLSTEEIDTAWEAYKRYLTEQPRGRKALSDHRITIRQLLQRLPNLHRTTVACLPSVEKNSPWSSNIYDQEPFLINLTREVIVSPKIWLVCPTFDPLLPPPSFLDVAHAELEDACSLA